MKATPMSLPQRLQGNRWVVYVYCFTTVSLTAGTVYGWPALRQALQSEENTSSWSSETALGVAFTVGAWSTQGMRFFAGMARDRFGTRWVAVGCLLAVALGAIGIALANNTTALAVALFSQGIGSGIQLSVQPVVAACFPQYSGAVLASLSGAFQISGLVYLVLVKASKGDIRTAFFVFAALIVCLAGVALCLLPTGLPEPPSTTENVEEVATTHNTHDRQNSDDDNNLEEQIAGKQDDQSSSVDMENTRTPSHKSSESRQQEMSLSSPSSSQAPCEHPTSTDTSTATTSAWQQVKSWKYILLLQWFSLTITPLQYYIGSLGFQLEDMGDSSGKYSDLYSILYGCAAVISPLAGLVADRYSLGMAQAMATALAALSFFWLALDQIPLEYQTIGLACNATGRMWIFATYFAHVGQVFGYQHYGTLAGLGLLVSAVVSLLQYPLLAAAAHGHAFAINVACGILVGAELLYCYALHRQTQRSSAIQ